MMWPTTRYIDFHRGDPLALPVREQKLTLWNAPGEKVSDPVKFEGGLHEEKGKGKRSRQTWATMKTAISARVGVSMWLTVGP